MNLEALRDVELNYAQNLSKTMLEWEEKQKLLLLEILRKTGIPLKKQYISQLIKATEFEQICSPENAEYCQLYLKKEKCHPELSTLNCGLCNCPNYNASAIKVTTENVLIGACNQGSRKAFYHFSQLFPRVGVLTCEQCHIHHSREFLRKYLEKTFEE